MRRERYSHLWLWLSVMVIWSLVTPHVALSEDVSDIKRNNPEELKVWADIYGLCLSIELNKLANKNFDDDLERVTPVDEKDQKSTFLQKLVLSPFMDMKDSGTTDSATYRSFLVGDQTELTVERFLSACSELKGDDYLIKRIKFWYPEYYLLHQQDGYIATGKSRDSWYAEISESNSNKQPPSEAMIVTEQPEMDKEQWAVLKEAMRERWQTPHGVTMGSHVKTWLYQYHTMEHFPGAKPTIGGANDLRGFLFDASFKIVGCNFQYTDLWGAKFEGGTILKAEFSGAKIADVLFDNVDLEESSFIGATDKYGPHFSTFRKSNLSRTMWKNARINGVVFSESNLQGSRFINCDFSNTLFLSSNLSGAVFENCTFGENVKMYNCVFGAVDLKNTRLPSDVFSVPENISSEIDEKMFSADERKVLEIIKKSISHFYDGAPSYIGKASINRLQETAKSILRSLQAARLSLFESYLYKIQGVEGDNLFFTNMEERAIHDDEGLKEYLSFDPVSRRALPDDGREDARRDLRHINEHFKANFLESGRKEAYRQFFVRCQLNRGVSWMNKPWLVLEGVSSGFGTRPGRFVFFFGFSLSLGALILGRHLIVKRMWNDQSLYYISGVCLVGYLILSGLVLGVYATIFLGGAVILFAIIASRHSSWFDIRITLRNLAVSLSNLLAEILPGIDSATMHIKTNPDAVRVIDETENSNEEEDAVKWILFIRVIQIYLVYQCTRMLNMWWL